MPEYTVILIVPVSTKIEATNPHYAERKALDEFMLMHPSIHVQPKTLSVIPVARILT